MMTGISDWHGKKVWLIGASQGIGRSLAKALADKGAVLALTARDSAALEILVTEIGRPCLIVPLDVQDITQVQKGFEVIHQTWGTVDVVIYGAATYTRGPLDELTEQEIAATIQTNLVGAVNVLSKVIPFFKQQKEGQIAVVASIAGYRGLPNTNVYGPTKAALINLCEGLHVEMRPFNVFVRVINPGFVTTRLTDKNPFPMPFIISADQAANAIVAGFKKNGFEIDFPKKLTFILKILQLLPNKLYLWLAEKYIISKK